MSYRKYRKRDKSEINKKYEIGLSRVDNYNSSDISEAVMHSVRDYLYTPYFTEITSDRLADIGIIRLNGSSHTMFITSLCSIATGTGRRVIDDSLCGELIYQKPVPTDKGEIDKCPVEFKITINESTSKILLDSYLTVVCYKRSSIDTTGGSEIITFVGLDMFEQRPYSQHGIRYVGVNLHDYTLGQTDEVSGEYWPAVDYFGESGDGYLMGTPNSKIIVARWRFRIRELISGIIGVPIYNSELNKYISVGPGSAIDSNLIDVGTINDVPYCGVPGVLIDGKDARHITVKAYHKGPSLEEAGEHYWEVLKNYPNSIYSTRGPRFRTEAALAKENNLADKSGLVILSEYDNSTTTIPAFLDSLGFYNGDVKDEDLSIETVLTTGILKHYHSLLEPYFKRYAAQIQALTDKVNDLQNQLDTTKQNVETIHENIPDPPAIEPVVIEPIVVPDSITPIQGEDPEPVEKDITVNISPSILNLDTESTLFGNHVLTSSISIKLSDGTVLRSGDTSDGFNGSTIPYPTKVKYSWPHDTYESGSYDFPITVSYVSYEGGTEHLTQLRQDGYIEIQSYVNENGDTVQGIKDLPIRITLPSTNNLERSDFSKRYIKFQVRDEFESDENSSQRLPVKEAETKVQVNWRCHDSGRSSGAIIGHTTDWKATSDLESVVINDDGTLARPYTYYPFGTNCYLEYTAEEAAALNYEYTLYTHTAEYKMGTYRKTAEPGTRLLTHNWDYDREDPERVSYPKIDPFNSDVTGIDNMVEIFHLTLPKPGIEDKTVFYIIRYGATNEITLYVKVKAVVDSISIDPDYLYWDWNRTGGQLVTVNTKTGCTYDSDSIPDWIRVTEDTNNRFYVTNVGYNESTEPRTGSITWTSGSGLTATLNLFQEGTLPFMYVIPQGGDPEYDKVTPGNTYSENRSSRNEELYTFDVYTNVDFEIWVDNSFVSRHGSTGENKTPIRVTLPANPGYDPITTRILVVSQYIDGGDILLELTKPGQEDTMIVSSIQDNVFHKEDAFDPLRTEKIFTITTAHPENLSYSLDNDDRLIAKTYSVKSSNDRYETIVHVYPGFVKNWTTDQNVNLTITYGSQTKVLNFVVEATSETVGQYFNVDSTIHTFKRNDLNNVTLNITAFAVSGELTLERSSGLTDSQLTIGSRTQIGNNDKYHYYKWTVSIKKGQFPTPGLPWTLVLSNGTGYKYINIYEESDIKIGDTIGFQVTAFGHTSIMDGCAIMPIIYELKRAYSYIGTDKHTDGSSSSDPEFKFVQISHDISSLSFSEINHRNVWSLDKNNGILRYTTCNNLGSISESQNNAIICSYKGNTCQFSCSLDTSLYYDQGRGYTTTYGAEYADSRIFDTDHNIYPLLPSTKCTINPIYLNAGDVIERFTYKTQGIGPNFWATPPDWRIVPSVSNTVSLDGYLTLPALTTDEPGLSYLLNTKTNWSRETSIRWAVQSAGINLYRSKKVEVVINTEPETTPEEVIVTPTLTPVIEEDTSGGVYLYNLQGTGNRLVLNTSLPITFASGWTSDPIQSRFGGGNYIRNNRTDNATLSLVHSNNVDVPTDSTIITETDIMFNASTRGYSFNTPDLDQPGRYGRVGLKKNFYAYDTNSKNIYADNIAWTSFWNGVPFHGAFYDDCIHRLTMNTQHIGGSSGVVCKCRVGICGLALPNLSSNSVANILFLPYVDIESQSGTTTNLCRFIIEDFSATNYGIGHYQFGKHDVGLIGYDTMFKTYRQKWDNHGRYYPKVSISATDGVTGVSSGMTASQVVNKQPFDRRYTQPSIHSSNFYTSDNIDVTIDVYDFGKMIQFFMQKYHGMTGLAEKILFESTSNSCIDFNQNLVIPPYGYMKDLKVKVVNSKEVTN